ncbi:MAG: hypothetical protein WHS86_15665 [Desulfosoma sp.]
MKRKPWRMGIGAFWALVLAASLSAHAQEWYVTPWIEARTEYNSNVLYTAENEVDDIVLRIRPGFSAVYGMERTRWTWDTALEGQVYADNSGLNTVDVLSTAGVVHQWTDRLSSRAGFYFLKDETLDSELQESGLYAKRETRYTYGPDFGISYLLTDRVGIDGGLGLRRTDYDYDPYPDRTTWIATVSPYYMVTPRDRVGVSFGVSYSDYENTSTIATFSNSLFWRRELAESAYLLLSAGYRVTRTTLEENSIQIVIDPITNELFFVPITKERSSSDLGFIFAATLVKELTETVSVSLSAGRDQYNSVTAASNERTFLRGTTSWRLSERTTAHLSAGYDYTTEEAGVGDEKTHYVFLSPHISYRLRQNLSLLGGAAYEHSFVDYASQDTDKNRQRLWAGLRYEWPRAWGN